MNKIEAVIFDMDGLLIDSEPLWQKAEIKVFGRLGIKLTSEMCEPLQGVKLEDAVEHWYNYQPWENKNIKETVNELIEEMKILLQNPKVLPGVYDVINFYHKKKIPMAVASSSSMSLIEIVVDKLGIREKIDILHSSEFEKAGKPSPDVFLTTAKLLGIKPENCLVFEDSINGVKAAKAAGMKVVAIPYPENFDRPELKIADWKVKSLSEWKKHL
ncbi:MAG: hexitol phosphatase HxpB [Bacteroidales bacterium]|nr:hexitol phosphatase HxpB [Bacteroidales bacterium]